MRALERAEKALRNEVERQVQAQGSFSGPENECPDYVDATLDYPALCRAVLMAVREPDEDVVSFTKDDWSYVDREDIRDIYINMIDAILGEGEGE